MKVTFPTFYRINLKIGKNLICQLGAPQYCCDANLETLTGRKRYKLTDVVGGVEIDLLTTSSRPNSTSPSALWLAGVTVENDLSELDLSGARWLNHQLLRNFAVQADFERNVSDVRDSWQNAFTHKVENIEKGIYGLRPPQIGGVHSVQGHWSVHSSPATVVLPTGVGKTETMLSLLVAERCDRLLVVVPTDALRTQLFGKFVTLGLLKSAQFQVIAQSADYPVVGRLMSAPADKESLEAYVKKCNVIVTTMPLAMSLPPEQKATLASLSPFLFIDEAHHIAAKGWREFKKQFAGSRIVQFTATPFRNDGRPIESQRVFAYPLKQAQEDGYFKPIVFKPVIEFDSEKRDSVIAEAAVTQLRLDYDKGHILMARTADTARANKVFECYRGYTEFSPVQLHSGVASPVERAEARRKLLSGESRIVVCVDMLGEGFDLPELKIAALHDIRKSLAVTLQLAGRFTRTKPNLGSATFIANIADVDVKIELRKLYQHDSDWNALLPILSEQASSSEFNLWEFLRGFQDFPQQMTLHNVRPAMSTVVYRTKCNDWTPERFEEGIKGFNDLNKVYHGVNAHEKTLVIVTARRISVEWAQIDEIHNWDWQLYVLHWDQDKKLLYIHNSINAGFFKKLATAVAGEVEQIKGPEIFRCLAGINRLKLQNVGLLEQLGRLIRYTMRAGGDVEAGMTETQKRQAIKSNLFGQGFEKGTKVTIGCSYKGRIWSYRTTNLMELTHWCESVGAKLTNTALDPEEVLNGTLVPVMVAMRPSKVLVAIEWPIIFWKEPEQAFCFEFDGKRLYPYTSELELSNTDISGPLTFSLKSDGTSVEFELVLNGKENAPDFEIVVRGEIKPIIKYRSQSLLLTEFLTEHPPTIWFADGSSLTGIEYVELRRQPEPFPRDRIERWDWTGTNIRVESQGIDRDPQSVQFRVIVELKKRPFTVIMDDDDAGEAADIVGITEGTDSIDVEFWHCKFSTEDTPGSRIKELYELCGQAQKCIRWLEKPRDLFTHLLRREPRRFKGRTGTRYELGTEMDLLRLREKTESLRMTLKVIVIQPGLSFAKASSDQLELLAVTENYLMETYAIPFEVIASP